MSKQISGSLVLALLAAAGLAGCASAPPQPSGTAATPAAPAMPAAAPSRTVPAAVPSGDASLQRAFDRWVEAFSASARAAGIRDDTLHAAFDGVRYLPRVIERDGAQPEFTRTPWDYIEGAISAQKVARGQARLAQLAADPDASTSRFGVPLAVVVAIWGMESDYGRNYGDIPTIDALATLAFQGRREEWARGQLLAALHILQRGDIGRADMIGSWAGAMGQTQFLPSAFLDYAVDADGDGRRDIWHSLADVAASTANFLARAGWQADEPWGAEVRLPAGFDYGRADAELRQSSARWAEEGLQGMDGGPLPAMADAAVLLPAGARGPAFLVGANFRALLRYNNSTSYALAVGLLAQQVAGGRGVQGQWPRELQALTRTQLRALQAALNEGGFDSGVPDGLLGPATRGAVRRYQRSAGLPADGYPTPELLDRLLQP